jgi:hypothetical protein
LLINLYDNPRKLYKYYPFSKEYAVKLADDEKRYRHLDVYA